MKRRSGTAQAALLRKAGPMKHRLQPRGGARNKRADLMEDDEPDPSLHQSDFRPGTVVTFAPENFDPDFWGRMPEEERILYFGWAGYGSPRRKLFVYLCPIFQADGSDSGHCVLVSLDDQRIETMRHPTDFRKATDEEF